MFILTTLKNHTKEEVDKIATDYPISIFKRVTQKPYQGRRRRSQNSDWLSNIDVHTEHTQKSYRGRRRQNTNDYTQYRFSYASHTKTIPSKKKKTNRYRLFNIDFHTYQTQKPYQRRIRGQIATDYAISISYTTHTKTSLRKTEKTK